MADICALCQTEIRPGDESPLDTQTHFDCDIEFLAMDCWEDNAEEQFRNWYWELMINC